jgi:hypothetical protein
VATETKDRFDNHEDLSAGPSHPISIDYYDVIDEQLAQLDDLNHAVVDGDSDEEYNQVVGGAMQGNPGDLVEFMKNMGAEVYQPESRMPNSYDQFTVPMSPFNAAESYLFTLITDGRLRHRRIDQDIARILGLLGDAEVAKKIKDSSKRKAQLGKIRKKIVPLMMGIESGFRETSQWLMKQVGMGSILAKTLNKAGVRMVNERQFGSKELAELNALFKMNSNAYAQVTNKIFGDPVLSKAFFPGVLQNGQTYQIWQV